MRLKAVSPVARALRAQVAGTALKDTAARLGIELKYVDVATPKQLDQFVGAPLDERFGRALLVGIDVLYFMRRSEIVEFARRRGLAMFARFIEDGALMSFEGTVKANKNRPFSASTPAECVGSS